MPTTAARYVSNPNVLNPLRFTEQANECVDALTLEPLNVNVADRPALHPEVQTTFDIVIRIQSHHVVVCGVWCDGPQVVDVAVFTEATDMDSVLIGP